jgi:hypothetical protein
MLKPVISADSHVCEPPNCFVDYIDPKFRDRAPRLERDPKRGDIYRIEGSQTPIPLSLISAAGKSPDELSIWGASFEQLHRGGWDPDARLLDQDADGIAAEVIYPSVGMEVCNLPDLDLKYACMRAYNRWLAEFCAPHPHRLIGKNSKRSNRPGSKGSCSRACRARKTTRTKCTRSFSMHWSNSNSSRVSIF